MTIERDAHFPWHSSLRRIRVFVHNALSHATRPLIAVALLLGVGRIATVLIGTWLQGWITEAVELAWVRTFMIIIAVPDVLLAVLLAEEGVRIGLSRWPTYVAAVTVASLWAALLHAGLFKLQCAMDWGCSSAAAGRPLWHLIRYNTADVLSRGGLAAFIYANREQMLRSMRELGAAQLERAEVEQKLAQTELQALQAQVDPAAFFDTLKFAQRLYRSDAAAADRTLDELIEHLRAASAKVQT